MSAVHEQLEFESVQPDARGGIRREVSPHMLFRNQVRLCQNAYIHRGGIRTVSGYSAALTTVPVTTRGLAARRVYDLVSGNLTIAQYANGRMYRLSGQRMGPIGSGLAAAARVSITEANRLVYVTDGVAMRLWSGTRASAMKTATAPAQMPRFLFYHQDSNRLFAGRGATTKNRVWFSAVNAFTTWQTNNFIDIPESRTGDRVMGFARLLGNLAIFGERTVSVLFGRTPSDYRLRTLEWSRGCLYPHTICSFGHYVLYLGVDGIYKFDGSGSARRISEFIEDLIPGDMVTGTEDGPIAHINRDGDYVLSYASKGSSALANNREITVLKPSPEGPYWHFQGPNTRGFGGYARYDGGVDNNDTYAVTAGTDGQLFRIDSGPDYAGTAADLDVESGELDLGAPFVRKVFQGVEIHAETSGDASLEIWYKIDRESNWRSAGSVSLQVRGQEYGARTLEVKNRARVIHPLYLDGTQPLIGNYIQFRFRRRQKAGVSQPVNILMWRCWAKSWRAGP